MPIRICMHNTGFALMEHAGLPETIQGCSLSLKNPRAKLLLASGEKKSLWVKQGWLRCWGGLVLTQAEEGKLILWMKHNEASQEGGTAVAKTAGNLRMNKKHSRISRDHKSHPDTVRGRPASGGLGGLCSQESERIELRETSRQQAERPQTSHTVRNAPPGWKSMKERAWGRPSCHPQAVTSAQRWVMVTDSRPPASSFFFLINLSVLYFLNLNGHRIKNK